MVLLSFAPPGLSGLTRDFVRTDILGEEKSQPGQAATAAFRTIIVNQKKTVFDPTLLLPLLHQTFTEILWKNNFLESRKRVVALILRGLA